MAFGQAAMLLAIGKKGYRAVLPNSSSKNPICGNFRKYCLIALESE
jgi:hypothetical protein